MSDIVQHSSFTLMNPATGEVVALDGPTEDLGQFLADLREHESMWREAKKLVTRELVARMDKSASWTLHVNGLKLSTQSPAPSEEFNGPELREALLDLVDEGVVTIEAVDAAVETVVTYKPRKAGINALRKLGGRVVDAINAHRTETEKDRYISVGRA